MDLHTNLLVDINPESTQFLTLNGQPVWPVCRKEDLYALTELVKVFSGRINLVNGTPGLGEIVGSEVVVGLGKDVEKAAQLYAHLTQRKYQKAHNLDDISNTTSLAVVVTTAPWLDNRLMKVMYSSNTYASVPGIICAVDLNSLYRQVLLRSAAAVLGGLLEHPRIDILPSFPVTKLTTSSHEIIGGKAAKSDVTKALKRSAGVLTIATHADGIDALLNKEMILCPMDKMPVAADRFRSPRCVITGICHRQETSIENALKSGNLISPDVIAARILIFEVCWGLLQPKGELDPTWGLGNHLIDQSTIGAIVTTWEIFQSNKEDIDLLSRTLLYGKSVGEALAEYNRTPNSRQWNQRMCLIGDPRVSLPSIPSVKQFKYPNKKSSVDLKVYLSKDPKRLNFIRACLTNTISNSSKKGLLMSAEEALDAVEGYEFASKTDISVEGYENAPGPTMRRAVLKYICCRKWIFQDWWPLAYKHQTIENSKPCFGCTQFTKTIIVSLRVPGTLRREVTFCPQCGLVKDAPIGTNIEISMLNRGALQLKGHVPTKCCNLGLHLRSPLPSDCKWWKWPTNSNGEPLKTFRPPEEWPVGPLRISVIILWETNIAIFSQMGRNRVILQGNN